MRSSVSGSVLLRVCGVGLALSFAPLAEAAKPPSSSELTVTTTIFKAGKAGDRNKRVLSGEKNKAGDILVYRASYRNETKRLLKDIVATMPLPPGMIYVADSGVPVPVQASKDGKAFFLITAAPPDAPPSNWRAIRWAPREIGPLSESFFEFRARVLGTADD